MNFLLWFFVGSPAFLQSAQQGPRFHCYRWCFMRDKCPNDLNSNWQSCMPLHCFTGYPQQLWIQWTSLGEGNHFSLKLWWSQFLELQGFENMQILIISSLFHAHLQDFRQKIEKSSNYHERYCKFIGKILKTPWNGTFSYKKTHLLTVDVAYLASDAWRQPRMPKKTPRMSPRSSLNGWGGPRAKHDLTL